MKYLVYLAFFRSGGSIEDWLIAKSQFFALSVTDTDSLRLDMIDANHRNWDPWMYELLDDA
jgi:hypothetical protein